MYQVSLSNDFSLNFQTYWSKVHVSTYHPLIDLMSNHFYSKNSNHRSIEIEILYIYFHCLPMEMFLDEILYVIISTFKAYRYLHSFEFWQWMHLCRYFIKVELTWKSFQLWRLFTASHLRMGIILNHLQATFPFSSLSNVCHRIRRFRFIWCSGQIFAIRLADFVSFIFIVQS